MESISGLAPTSLLERAHLLERWFFRLIDIKQKKTGAKVAIPCSSQLMEILRKYDFQMPHLEDQVISRYPK